MDARLPQNGVEQRTDVASDLAKRLAPELRAAVDVEFTQLVREYRPMGRAEEVLVREMARHVVALTHAEKVEPSVLAMNATMVADIKDTGGDSGLDSALAATALGEHVITREELLACCTNRPMAKSWSEVKKVANIIMVAGVDWGGGSHSRTVITVGYPAEDGKFHICFLQRLHAHEEPSKILEMVASISRLFRVSFVAADGGGNGHVYNRLLAGKLHGFADIFSIHYSPAESEPVPDGVLWKWTVNRSRAIGSVFARFKEKQIELVAASSGLRLVPR